MSRKTVAAIVMAMAIAVIGIVAVVAMVSVASADDRVRALEDETNGVRAKVSQVDARPSAVVDQVLQSISEIRSRAEKAEEVDFAELMSVFPRMQAIRLRLSDSQKDKLHESCDALFQHTDLFNRFGEAGYDMIRVQLAWLSEHTR